MNGPFNAPTSSSVASFFIINPSFFSADANCAFNAGLTCVNTIVQDSKQYLKSFLLYSLALDTPLDPMKILNKSEYVQPSKPQVMLYINLQYATSVPVRSK